MADLAALKELCQRIDTAMQMKASGAISSGPLVLDLPRNWNKLMQEKFRVWCATRLFDIQEIAYSPEGRGSVTIVAPTPSAVETSSSLILDKGLTLPRSIHQFLYGDLTDINCFNQDYQASIDCMCADMLVIGAGFYAEYLRGTKLADFGIVVRFKFTAGIPAREMNLEGRAFCGDDRIFPFASEEFQSLLVPYRTGFLRFATTEERDLFYTQIDFEIAGNPVHILEAEAGRLLIFIQADGRLRWIDYLDRYKVTPSS